MPLITSADIKLSKAELTKIIQEGRFHGKTLGNGKVF